MLSACLVLCYNFDLYFEGYAAFMSAKSAAMTKTPIEAIADSYWQDYVMVRPIDSSCSNSVAYETELRSCQLDETLISLQRVDDLLLTIRRNHIKAGTLVEKELLADERYRHLLLFLAFYAGRVLAKQWQYVPHWYEASKLRSLYPKLPLSADNFYHRMAVYYRDDIKHDNSNANAELFFALEPIGLRLFGSVDRKFLAVQGGQVANGLYQAVTARLPATNQNLPPVIQEIPASTNDSGIKVLKAKVTPNHSSIAKPSLKSVPQEKKITPTPEIFTQLLIELDEIEMLQNIGDHDYQRARKVLDQFERHIAHQNKPRAQVLFAASHREARQQALSILKQAASDGHTSAMLRLAMYELLGEGLLDNQKASREAGTAWVKQAADKQDSRAQRLLSKMYYQGVGVPQDIDEGQLWLERAAKNGHLEAADLIEKWQQAQTLILTQKQEQHSIKRYQLLIGAVVAGSLLLMVLI